MDARTIKRNILAMYGLDGLSDEQIDEAILYGNEKEGVVVRFKAAIRTKDWRIHQVICN
jgi:hypothetical protein